ncbi:MAG: glycolate oxidase subunit GlcD [Latescibacteria bacterium DG_63]|nr:MAG: glycolate oxidase subunit GlcD [Latescibacteria bacterium DG_63]
MKDSTLKKLREIVGSQSVLTAKEELLCHSYDATRRSALPEVVVRPENVEQVAAVARLCTEERIPLTPRGAGTGLSGGSVPLKGGVLLSLTRMKRIRELVLEDLYAVVEAGMVTEELQTTVEASSLFYPPDPASQSSCTIGGNVATSAGGLRCLKYGVTKNYLMGLEAVLPTGEVIATGARTVKSVVGFDLTRLICGSEGTLAIVTAATLKLIPLPEHRVTILAAFKELEQAARASADVISAGATPSILEIMDPVTVSVVSRESETVLPPESEGCSLLLAEADGFREAAEIEAERVQKVCSDSGAVFLRKSSETEERENLWQARRGVLAALAKLKPITILEDVTVPRSRVVEMIRSIEEIGKKYDLLVATFGHAGDGNLHPTILLDAPFTEKAARVEKAVAEIFGKALSLGGTLSGEHGIGIDKAGFLGEEIGEHALETMRRLKEVFDPEGILNPGKLFGGAESES